MSQVIPEAAVEAAAKADYGSSSYDKWATENAAVKDLMDSRMRKILEAAAPHMLAGARFDAWEEGVSYALPGTPRGMETFDALRKSNPYRPTP